MYCTAIWTTSYLVCRSSWTRCLWHRLHMLNAFHILGSSQQHSKIGKGGLFRPSAQPKAKEVTAEDRRDKRQGLWFTAFSITASMCIICFFQRSVRRRQHETASWRWSRCTNQTRRSATPCQFKDSSPKTDTNLTSWGQSWKNFRWEYVPLLHIQVIQQNFSWLGIQNRIHSR